MLNNFLLKKSSSVVLAMFFLFISVNFVCSASVSSPKRPKAQKQSSWMNVPSPSNDIKDAINSTYDEIIIEEEEWYENKEEEEEWNEEEIIFEEEKKEENNSKANSKEQSEGQITTINLNAHDHENPNNHNGDSLKKNEEKEEKRYDPNSQVSWKEIVFDTQEEQEDC